MPGAQIRRFHTVEAGIWELTLGHFRKSRLEAIQENKGAEEGGHLNVALFDQGVDERVERWNAWVWRRLSLGKVAFGWSGRG